MRFTKSNLKYFENPNKKIKNGEVLLLNNIGNGIQEKQYNVVSKLNNNNWNFYILLDKKSDYTVSLCQLIPYQNNTSWPFSPIMINTLNKKGKLIEQEFQPHLDAITNYHTIFNLSYYYFEHHKSTKRKQQLIKTFYGLTAAEQRIDAEILQVLTNSKNKFPIPERKIVEIRKKITKKSYLKKRWAKKENSKLNPNIIATILAEREHQSSPWSGGEFIILKNKLQTASDNNQRKIITAHSIASLKPFLHNLILIKKHIKTEQKKRNKKIINKIKTKLANLEKEITMTKQSFTEEVIQKLQNQVSILNEKLTTLIAQNQNDNKHIKFSKELISIINDEQLPKNKITMKSNCKVMFSNLCNLQK